MLCHILIALTITSSLHTLQKFPLWNIPHIWLDLFMYKVWQSSDSVFHRNSHRRECFTYSVRLCLLLFREEYQNVPSIWLVTASAVPIQTVVVPCGCLLRPIYWGRLYFTYGTSTSSPSLSFAHSSNTSARTWGSIFFLLTFFTTSDILKQNSQALIFLFETIHILA